MSQNLTLRFSLEEMSYLRRALELDSLPGLPPRTLPEASVEGQKLLLEAADRALRARGVVRLVDEDRRAIDPVTAGLLRTCAQAQPVLFLDVFRQGWGKGQWLYILHDQITFEQSEPEPGVLQFVLLPTRVEFQTRLRQIVQLANRHGFTSLEHGQLAPSLLEEGTKIAASEPEQAQQIFARELPESTAQALAQTLHTIQSAYYLARWSAQDAQVERYLTILQSEEYLFLLVRQEADAPYLDVFPATVEQIWSKLALLLPRLQGLAWDFQIENF